MITSALGVAEERFEVQLLEYACQPGDTFLLCSDGLTARLDDDDLRRLLVEHEEPRSAANALVEAANQAGGPDNITVGLVRIE
jgi:serine/threonine protein phosphatase PrpC